MAQSSRVGVRQASTNLITGGATVANYQPSPLCFLVSLPVNWDNNIITSQDYYKD